MAAALPLLIVYGSGTVYALPLVGQDEWTLGRGSENAIVLRDQGVSRQHALLKLINDEVWLLDLNSRNGVWVNGQRVQGEIKLSHGDRLILGQTELEFQQQQSPELQQAMQEQGLVLLAFHAGLQAEIWRDLLASQGLTVCWETSSNFLATLKHLDRQGNLPALILMEASPTQLAGLSACRQFYPQLPVVLVISYDHGFSTQQEEWAAQQGVAMLLSALPRDDLAAHGAEVAARLKQVLKRLGWHPLQEEKMAATLLELQTKLIDDTPSQILSQFILPLSGKQPGERKT